jgi:transcriptional regulator with XRE-family HTH domain
VDDRFFVNGTGVEAAARFGRELRCRRTQAGLTQRQLADQVRYSREMVAAVERGRRYGSHSLAVACDAVLGTDGVLTRLWPMVETEQVAADRRRGPRPDRLGVGRLDESGRPEPLAPLAPLARLEQPHRSAADWADWAEQIRPAMGGAPPELVDQLRDLINNLALASDRDAA